MKVMVVLTIFNMDKERIGLFSDLLNYNNIINQILSDSSIKFVCERDKYNEIKEKYFKALFNGFYINVFNDKKIDLKKPLMAYIVINGEFKAYKLNRVKFITGQLNVDFEILNDKDEICGFIKLSGEHSIIDNCIAIVDAEEVK